MANTRSPSSHVPSVTEDAELFKRELRLIPVELLPVFDQNSHGDLVVKGIVQPESEVEVLFAGRRAWDARALTERLYKMRMQSTRSALTSNGQVTQVRSMRLQAQVEGCWRVRLEPDASGWEVKIYQLIAAQWSFTDDFGNFVRHGRPPAKPADETYGSALAALEQQAASDRRQGIPGGAQQMQRIPGRGRAIRNG